MKTQTCKIDLSTNMLIHHKGGVALEIHFKNPPKMHYGKAETPCIHFIVKTRSKHYTINFDHCCTRASKFHEIVHKQLYIVHTPTKYRENEPAGQLSCKLKWLNSIKSEKNEYIQTIHYISTFDLKAM